MSKLSFVFVATALAAVFVAASVQAQPPAGGGRRGGMRGGGPMQTLMLLRNTKVQEDLGLSDQQKEDLTKLATDLRGGGGQATAEERQTRAANFQKGVEKILKPEQVTRLKEIGIQREGALAAANNADVAKALAVTADQKEKLAAITKSVGEKMRGLASADRSERREKMAEIQKDAKKQALEVLTQDQRDKLDKMGGKKIDLD